ncbi:SMP-30/gluconolactonase/LRE family protein [Pseudonocardia sp. Cha107L01]|uniref:SMP-30/gluconolactonase/LRE family protein n=1 Tax=Pseudonocardia sp. Cha107L01 TaxID=3457576 RepID=UPI00403E63AD
MTDSEASTDGWTAVPGERFALGEGLRDVGDHLIMVDILTGRLLALPADLAGPPRVLLELADPLGAVAPLAGGGWVAATGTGIALIGAGAGAGAAGEVHWLARPEDGAPHRMRMNDGVADPSGRFWAGSMAYDTAEGAGALYRVDVDGSVHRVVGELTVPNGPAFTPDGELMYLADSARGVIYRYPVDPRTGGLGRHTEFATVADGSPDGMTVDAEGYLWSAIWGAGEIRRFSPTGSVDRVLAIPAGQPTSVCLSGGRLVATSATVGLVEPAESDGAVQHIPVPVRGVPAARAGIAAAR